MNNESKNTPVKNQAVLMVVINDLRTTEAGKPAISGLFRNPDGTAQNFSASGDVATRLSNFRKGSLLLVTGFSAAKTVNKKDGSGTKDVLDIIVRGFQVDKVAQAANKAAYAASLAAVDFRSHMSPGDMSLLMERALA